MDESTKLNELLHLAVEEGASDLHLTVGCHPAIRVDGRLRFLTDYDVLTPEHTARMVATSLTDHQRQRLESQLDLDLPFSLPGISRFRVNVYHQRGSLALAIRVIPAQIPSLDELEMPTILKTLTERRSGLILVTGPTGVGKSTTLAAMIRQINRNRSHHIITIEDPVEYLHHHDRSIINQREVGTDVRDFAGGLRSALREDPDIIMVGEMRDLETTETALIAAETGHLVMASLHTRDAASTVDRIIDQFPSHQQPQIRAMLSGVLEAVVSQQLLSRRAGKGRIAALEIMISTPAIRNLVREGKAHMLTGVIQTGTRYGMQTMDQGLADLYRAGRIAYDDAMSSAYDSEELSKIIGGGGV